MTDAMQAEIDKMLDSMGNDNFNTEGQAIDNAAPNVSAEQNTEPAAETDPAQQVEDSSETIDSTSVDSPTEQVKQLEERLEAMTQQLEALAQKTLQLQMEKQNQQQQQQPESDIPFATEDEYNEVLANPDGLNKFAKKLVSRTIEETLKRVVPVAQKISQHQLLEFHRLQEFFEANPDLKAHKTLVGVTATELRANNPSWNVDQLFTEAAKETRNRLKKERQRSGTATGQVNKPLNAGIVNGTRPAPNKPANPVESQLDEMIQAVLH